MKKRIVACMLALTVAFSMTACGDEKKDGTKETSQTDQQDETEDEDIEEEDVETEEETEPEEEAEQEEVTAERGTVEGSVYTNESMGIQLTLPEGSTLLSDEEIADVVGSGADLMEEAGTDEDALANSLSGTVYDIIAVTADEAANIQIIMEDTENTAGRALSAEEYAQAMASSLKVAYASAGVEVGETEMTEETLGGMKFTKVSVDISGLNQEYYSHQVGKYMLVFAVTYVDAGAEDVQQFLDSVTAL